MVSDCQRLSFSQELTQTVTLGLSLGLGLAQGNLKYKNVFIYTTFKDFSLDVYDDIHVLHLVSDTQRLSFSQEYVLNIFYLRCDLKLTLTLTGGLTLASGLGLSPGKRISVENLKPNAKHEYHRRRTGKNH